PAPCRIPSALGTRPRYSVTDWTEPCGHSRRQRIASPLEGNPGLWSNRAGLNREFPDYCIRWLLGRVYPTASPDPSPYSDRLTLARSHPSGDRYDLYRP